MTNTNLFNEVVFCGDSIPDLEEFKKIYDYADYYDCNREYPKDVFEANYTGKNLKYCFALHHSRTVDIVVAKRVFTTEELEKVQEDCDCPYCTSAWYNPMKYFYCQVCHGCIKSGPEFASEKRVKDALKRIDT